LDPFDVTFDRSLDHALVVRCLDVIGPDGRRVDGTCEVGSEQRSWRLTPTEPWLGRPHSLTVDPDLEDLAGNSVARVFDRDLTDTEDGLWDGRPPQIMFSPRRSVNAGDKVTDWSTSVKD